MHAAAESTDSARIDDGTDVSRKTRARIVRKNLRSLSKEFGGTIAPTNTYRPSKVGAKEPCMFTSIPEMQRMMRTILEDISTTPSSLPMLQETFVTQLAAPSTDACFSRGQAGSDACEEEKEEAGDSAQLASEEEEEDGCPSKRQRTESSEPSFIAISRKPHRMTRRAMLLLQHEAERFLLKVFCDSSSLMRIGSLQCLHTKNLVDAMQLCVVPSLVPQRPLCRGCVRVALDASSVVMIADIQDIVLNYVGTDGGGLLETDCTHADRAVRRKHGRSESTHNSAALAKYFDHSWLLTEFPVSSRGALACARRKNPTLHSLL